MAFYRKKPVVIEAVQIRGDNDEELLSFLAQHVVPFEITGDHTLVIHTLEGDMTALPGDWIIRGVKGEFYPCKPDIFAVTYDFEQIDTAEIVDANLLGQKRKVF